MNTILFVLIIISGSTPATSVTVVGQYPEAVCLAMARRHNQEADVRRSKAYCNPVKS